MATICTHCGREVPPGNTVCPACGETVRSAIPAFMPVVEPGVQSQPPGYASSVASYPIPPQPAAQSGGALKIILIVVVVVVLLGIVAAGVVGVFVWHATKAVSNSIVHKNSNGDVTINTPGGAITSGSASTISESDLGVAIYPGATRGEGSMNMHTPVGSLISAVFLTSDSPTQVVDFYKAKLGSDTTDVSAMQSGNATMITSGADSKNKVMVTVTSVDNGKTRINILHTTKK